MIARLLQGRSTVVLLPTGGGKSLTYQYSGMLLPGMTIIVDPLIALMIDQVDNLRGFAIDMVAAITSIMETQDRERVIGQMGAGDLAFVFISPERLQSEDFRQRLQDVAARLPISLAVVDEAHCVSEWGHDFRPSYLHMTHNLQKFCASAASKPTLVALTGTASFAVLTDIQAELGITDESAIVLLDPSTEKNSLSRGARAS
ncbi:DEAD/DEAH box helicase [Rhodothermus marinus]|uniref:DEAD/DEAH box helicase n=1 Tax=Rhodothermus marinus TaxID=29549 RepID=UPI000B254716|nr:DEAD/DEAH box helicase [Rhodothermus marinus]